MYTVYEEDGTISKVGNWEEGEVPLVDGQRFVAGKFFPFEYYVDPEDGVPKKKRIMVLEMRGGCICGVPSGSVMTIEELTGVGYRVKDEDCVCELDEPGEYHVSVHHPHYTTGRTVVKVE